MTCIVGIVSEETVYMGADSCASNGHSWLIVGNPKVFKVGQFLIGCTSSFRMIDLLRYNLTITRPHPEDSDDKFIRSTFVDNVRDCLKSGGLAKKESDKETGGNFLVGYKGRLYEVQVDYSVLNCPDWGSSVGSGESAARGSLWTTRDAAGPQERVLMALESAEAVVPSVRGPMIVLTLEDEK